LGRFCLSGLKLRHAELKKKLAEIAPLDNAPQGETQGET
jgi:hypothetical protein